jgi:hypothetical protein
MAINKKSLIGAGATKNREAEGTSTKARKLAVAKLATAKLSTAKLTTLRRLT